MLLLLGLSLLLLLLAALLWSRSFAANLLQLFVNRPDRGPQVGEQAVEGRWRLLRLRVGMGFERRRLGDSWY